MGYLSLSSCNLMLKGGVVKVVMNDTQRGSRTQHSQKVDNRLSTLRQSKVLHLCNTSRQSNCVALLQASPASKATVFTRILPAKAKRNRLSLEPCPEDSVRFQQFLNVSAEASQRKQEIASVCPLNCGQVSGDNLKKEKLNFQLFLSRMSSATTSHDKNFVMRKPVKI